MTDRSVQLYSVRDAMAADISGTVARLREIGFELVEPYAFTEQTDALEHAMRGAGVSAPTAHVSIHDRVETERVWDAAEQLGIETVIEPFIPSQRWQTADDARRIADRVSELAAEAATRGLRFGYHNHQWEFINRAAGRPVYEIFVEHLSAEALVEVDTFWATVGGADTPAVLRALGDRVVAIHVKDGPVVGDIRDQLPSAESALDVPDALQRAFEGQVPAGQGDVDMPAVLAAAPQALRVVEFDAYAADVFDGIAESLTWLQEHDQ